MTLAFGYHKRAKAFERIHLFDEPLEIVVRDNSKVCFQLQGPVRVFCTSDDDDDDGELHVVTENSFVLRVSAQSHYRFEPSSRTACCVTTFVPDEESQRDLEQELIDEGYTFVTSVSSHYFLRPLEVIRQKLQGIKSVSLIGSIQRGLLREIQKCPNIKKLCLDLSVKYGDRILSAEIQELVQKMPWLEHVHIFDGSYHHRHETLDVFEGMPKFVTLSGNLKFGRYFERWACIERLELIDISIPFPFFQNLTNLKSLSLNMQDLSTIGSLTTLSRTVTELIIRRPRNYNRRTCVDIGRLLRRNQLKHLVLQRFETVTKNDFLYVILPLLDGSNTSLEVLDVAGTCVSTHTLYFFEDVINFCPTIQRIGGLNWFSHLWDTKIRRNTYAAVKPPLRALLDTARPGSVFARALELALGQVTTFAPTYRRSNRKWYRTGYREIVSTPLELY
jgi:hypothetical protein